MAATLVSHAPLRQDPPDERRGLQRALRGRYTILEPLGHGGMSVVYRAREHLLDREVALKVLARGLADRIEHRERFRREARILGALVHPSIVPVHAAGDADGLPFFTMRRVTGGSLAARLASGPRPGIDAACRILASLADALDLTHRRGIVHRDLKPDNILLDEDQRPVLVDFGVATVATSDHSRSEVVRAFGTPAYMSPEQALGEQECDGRSDLYALGVLGFELLAGRVPFRGRTPREIVAQHVARPAPPVSVFRPDVPPALERVIARCLAKKPDERWPDARSLVEALGRIGVDDAAAPRGRWRSLFRRVGR